MRFEERADLLNGIALAFDLEDAYRRQPTAKERIALPPTPSFGKSVSRPSFESPMMLGVH